MQYPYVAYQPIYQRTSRLNSMPNSTNLVFANRQLNPLLLVPCRQDGCPRFPGVPTRLLDNSLPNVPEKETTVFAKRQRNWTRVQRERESAPARGASFRSARAPEKGRCGGGRKVDRRRRGRGRRRSRSTAAAEAAWAFNSHPAAPLAPRLCHAAKRERAPGRARVALN